MVKSFFEVSMPFFKRRLVLFLLLDAFVLLGLMGVFAAVNHAFVSSSTRASKGAEPPAAAPASLQARQPSARETPSQSVEAAPLDLKRLLCGKVKVTFHTVEKGENYWTIARKNHINVYTLIGANPGLPFVARLRQVLAIPSREGVLHTVEKGETLEKIAEEYQTDGKTLRSENRISWWRGLREGDILFIPDAHPVRMVQEWRDYFGRRGLFGCPFSKWATLTSPFALRVDPITGAEHMHTGVDLRARYGDPVYAAASGKVVFTGVAGGYGNLIRIAHAHGYVTYYGHLSEIYAKAGQKVRRGALIGRVGATGRVTGPHLHFEIRRNGKPLDPLKFI